VAGHKLERVKVEALRDNLRVLGDHHLALEFESADLEQVDHSSPKVTPAHVAVPVLVAQELLDMDADIASGLHRAHELFDEETHVQPEHLRAHVRAVAIISDVFVLAAIHEQGTERNRRNSQIHGGGLEPIPEPRYAVAEVYDCVGQ